LIDGFSYDDFSPLNGGSIMVFNWFRRQFDSSPQAEPEVDETTADPVLDETEAEQEITADVETIEPVAAPSITFAQTIPAVTPEVAPEAAPEAVSADTLAWAKAAYENIKKQQQTTVPAEPIESVVSVGDPVVTDAVVTSEVVAVPESIAPEVLEAAIPDTRPAWAKENTAQARLAALRSESIEAPVEAEPIELDEDFLWSARVLADQGRSPEEVAMAEIAWLKKLRQGLNKTRLGLVNQVKALIGQGPLSAEATEVIETLLLQADVGIEATDYIIGLLQEKLRNETLPPEEAIAYLKQILRDLLDKPFQKDYSVEFFPQRDVLNIWMLTGVNGVGKTTTIGKLAHMTKASGYRCLIAAADTFRAAAVEQVKVWGQRSDIEVIANPGQNTDPAAVVFDAIAAAKSRNTELLLVDTAGRLQNKKNLMDELGKIRRIIDKQAVDAQVESLLVLDATLGQNGLRQAQVFAEAAKLSGVVLTKLDGTARGGVALAVVQQLGLPIRFIGAGEGIEDLRPFSSYEFVEALLSS
jgi:fused signal recognition particle receptor